MRFAYRAEDGRVIQAVVVANEPAEIERLRASIVPAGCLWVEMPDEMAAALPPPEFTDAWRMADDGTITVDMTVARALQMARWQERIPAVLTKLNGMVLESDDSGQVAAYAWLKSLRQKVRECISYDISSISDPQVLADTWPPVLVQAEELSTDLQGLLDFLASSSEK